MPSEAKPERGARVVEGWARPHVFSDYIHRVVFEKQGPMVERQKPFTLIEGHRAAALNAILRVADQVVYSHGSLEDVEELEAALREWMTQCG